jgi:hypothetical protein
MNRSLLLLAIIVVLVAGFVLAYLLMTPEDERAMDGMAPVRGPEIPLVGGFAEGEEIVFIHTEASAPQVAEMLTEMMGSPVLVVPALADVPQASRANVYVFTNGVEGDGPLGFQADVFDNPPGAHGYSPLRALNQVTWVNAGDAHELRSADEVLAAEARGAVTIEQPGVVLNMPMVIWPGGER